MSREEARYESTSGESDDVKSTREQSRSRKRQSSHNACLRCLTHMSREQARYDSLRHTVMKNMKPSSHTCQVSRKSSFGGYDMTSEATRIDIT